MFNPLKRFGADKGGMKVGIIGLGGLGQMGVEAHTVAAGKSRCLRHQLFADREGRAAKGAADG